MSLILLILFWFPISSDVPLKATDEFQFKLDYEFKNKPGVEKSDVRVSDASKYLGGQLPYVILRIIPTKLSGKEERVRIENNLGEKVYNRKANVDDEIILQMGFTDDLKDHISAYSFNVIFYSKKEDASRIHLLVEKDGTFLINGEKQAKF